MYPAIALCFLVAELQVHVLDRKLEVHYSVANCENRKYVVAIKCYSPDYKLSSFHLLQNVSTKNAATPVPKCVSDQWASELKSLS